MRLLRNFPRNPIMFLSSFPGAVKLAPGEKYMILTLYPKVKCKYDIPYKKLKLNIIFSSLVIHFGFSPDFPLFPIHFLPKTNQTVCKRENTQCDWLPRVWTLGRNRFFKSELESHSSIRLETTIVLSNLAAFLLKKFRTRTFKLLIFTLPNLQISANIEIKNRYLDFLARIRNFF